MENVKTGRFIADTGEFNARGGKEVVEGTYSVKMRFRVASDPSNYSKLEVIQKRVKLGRMWQTPDGRVCGWSVDSIPQMRALYALLRDPAYQAGHPRAAVIDAWGSCLDLLPSVLRDKLREKDDRYERGKWSEQRKNAVDVLARANRLTPPAYRVLPAGYFELWP